MTYGKELGGVGGTFYKGDQEVWWPCNICNIKKV